jgi:hypothetical protein
MRRDRLEQVSAGGERDSSSRRAVRLRNAGGAGAQVMYAYIKDRAAQYEPSSGIFCALNDELAPRILDGDAYSAYEHGELDDLMEEYHERTRRRDAALCR